MFIFLVTLLILVGIITMIVVLLQAGKGGGLAAVGGGAGTESFIGGRQAATILTKATWIGGGVFLGLSLILSVLSTRAQQPTSILQEEFRQTAPAAPAPVLPGLQPGETPAPDAADGAATGDAGAPPSVDVTPNEGAPDAAAEPTPDN
ncbi:MAG TPA: preprotein translocase subunit SecG [Longimicrobiales bacterium]|nr:preprotein translocase subunit SecG [Longimicrobiales bacterium]